MGPGVIFDFDGVVVDSEELHYRAYSEVLEEFGVTVDRALYGRVWIGEGRGLTFAVEARNEREKIGEGNHQRVVVKRDRLSRKE